MYAWTDQCVNAADRGHRRSRRRAGGRRRRASEAHGHGEEVMGSDEDWNDYIHRFGGTSRHIRVATRAA